MISIAPFAKKVPTFKAQSAPFKIVPSVVETMLTIEDAKFAPFYQKALPVHLSAFKLYS